MLLVILIGYLLHAVESPPIIWTVYIIWAILYTIRAYMATLQVK
jgi:hypothetical protein